MGLCSAKILGVVAIHGGSVALGKLVSRVYGFGSWVATESFFFFLIICKMVFFFLYLSIVCCFGFTEGEKRGGVWVGI